MKASGVDARVGLLTVANDTRPVLQFAGWRLDVLRRELRGGDNSLMMLSAAEFDLLLHSRTSSACADGD